MAEPRGQGFLSGYKGNLFQRAGRAFVNGILPGQQRAPDGTLNNRAVMLGMAGLPMRAIAGLYGGPMSGLAAGKLIGKGVDHFSGQGGDAAGIGPLTMQHFNPQTGLGVPNIGMAPGMTPEVPTMPPVNTQAPWQPMNPFAPGSGLAFVGSPQGRPIGGNLGFGSGHFNNGVGAGTGYGAANYGNDAFGSVAAGFGVGAGNSGFGNRQAGTDGRGFKNRV